MASLANTGCNTLERNIDGPQPKENNFDLIPLLFPPAQQPEIRAPAQRTFKRKMVSLLCQSRKLRQHQAPRSACGQFGEKRGKARCNQIGIDEVNHSAFARKILSRKCRFPGSIRPPQSRCSAATLRSAASLEHHHIITRPFPVRRSDRFASFFEEEPSQTHPHLSPPPPEGRGNGMGGRRIPISTYQEQLSVWALS